MINSRLRKGSCCAPFARRSIHRCRRFWKLPRRSSDRVVFSWERMGTLSGKIAWVTGGGSGIGQGAAVELARAGATVVVSGRRATALGETEAVDTSDKQAVVRASAAILARHGRIDILVNCAGTNVPKRFFKDLDAADWDRVVGVNL